MPGIFHEGIAVVIPIYIATTGKGLTDVPPSAQTPVVALVDHFSPRKAAGVRLMLVPSKPLDGRVTALYVVAPAQGRLLGLPGTTKAAKAGQRGRAFYPAA